jgi:hypothetical protein
VNRRTDDRRRVCKRIQKSIAQLRRMKKTTKKNKKKEGLNSFVGIKNGFCKKQ